MNIALHNEPAGVAGASGERVLGIAPTTVLVPMLNLHIAGDMLQLAAILAAGKPHSPLSPVDLNFAPDGRRPRIVVLGVVEVPAGQPLTTGMDIARSYRALFEFLPSEVTAGGWSVPVDRLVKVARDVPSAVRLAVADEQAGVVLAHWKGPHTHSRRQVVYGHILDALLKDPPCRVVVARPEGRRDCSRILLHSAGGPSSVDALDTALLLAEYGNLPLAVMPGGAAPAGSSGPSDMPGGADEVSVPQESDPYRAFNERLEATEKLSPVRIERTGTAAASADAILAEVQPYDLLTIGLDDPPAGRPRPPKGNKHALSAIVASTTAPVLLVRSPKPAPADDRHKVRTRQARGAWVDMPFEYWFVENTYHGDEFRDPEEFLKLKRAAGLTVSVALLTSNDAKAMHSIITGLKKVLMDMHPLADQIAVIDAGLGDDTPRIARSLGVDAYVASEILPGRESLHGRGESWWKSLAVLQGDIIVWLDPRCTRFHPSTALSLAGPLLRASALQLVKAFGPAQTETQDKGQAAQGEGKALTDMSWGGFVVPRRDGAWPFSRRIRVQALKPSDLAALTPAQFTTLPPRTILQVLNPALAGVVEPFGRDFAGRRQAMLSIPAFIGHNLDVGVLLSVAQKWGTRAVAQVELRHAVPAPSPQPSLRNSIDILQILSQRLEDPQLCSIAADTAERLRKELEGHAAEKQDARFQVRALNPVERLPHAECEGRGA